MIGFTGNANASAKPTFTLVAVNVNANAQVFYFDHSKGGKGSKCKGSKVGLGSLA